MIIGPKITPEMIAAGIRAWDRALYVNGDDKFVSAIYLAMERTRLSQEHSIRQSRLRVREK